MASGLRYLNELRQFSAVNTNDLIGTLSGSGLSDVVATPTVWTPTDASGAGLTLTNNNCIYTRVGPLWFIVCDVTYPSTANTANALIGGLPNAGQGLLNFEVNGTVEWQGGSGTLYFFIVNGVQLSFFADLPLTSAKTNANFSTLRLRFAFTTM